MKRITECKIGKNTEIRNFVDLYKCEIGDNCIIGSFVYIEEGVKIGNEVHIKPHVFIPTGVVIEDKVFIGPQVSFTNDRHPQIGEEWTLEETLIKEGASIGANSVILPGVVIGRNALIGAGSVVTKDIPDEMVAFGNPAKIKGRRPK